MLMFRTRTKAQTMRIQHNLYVMVQITNNLCSGVTRHYDRLRIFLELRVAA
jgi:hypothetical protein